MPKPLEHFPLDQDFMHHRGLSGIDEAGRGCLAGPVVVAAVTWNLEKVRTLDWFVHLADSKQLNASVRVQLYPNILAAAERVRVAVIHPLLIDLLNILKATFHGFEMVAPAYDSHRPLVIDGHLKPPSLPWAGTQVKGDSLLSPVSAAGVVAKVVRDGLMMALAKDHECYGFAKHKGYATALHRKAIAQHGACAHHRKSFRPVSDLVANPQPADDGLLQALEQADFCAAKELFAPFLNEYHRYSASAVHRAAKLFVQKGVSLLPRPEDLAICQSLGTPVNELSNVLKTGSGLSG